MIGTTYSTMKGTVCHVMQGIQAWVCDNDLKG